MFNMGNMMKQAQMMQERLQKAQEEIANLEVVGESGAHTLYNACRLSLPRWLCQTSGRTNWLENGKESFSFRGQQAHSLSASLGASLGVNLGANLSASLSASVGTSLSAFAKRELSIVKTEKKSAKKLETPLEFLSLFTRLR